MEKKKTAMPVIAGILMICSVALKLVAVLGFSFFMIVPASFPRFSGMLALLAFIPALALLALELAGGIFCLKRQKWGWALAGAIISVLPFSPVGIAVLILVVLSRQEFEQTSQAVN